MIKLMTMFSGGGGFDIGAKAAGLVPTVAIEYEAKIAEYYRRNLGDHVLVSDVAKVDYRPYHGLIDYLHASPSCVNASVANTNKGETPVDIVSAEAVCTAIKTILPKYFSLENVWGYRDFQSFRNILYTLETNGYLINMGIMDFSYYNVPQRRKRLILMAVKGGDRVPTFPQKQPVKGWYQAIADLIPSLEVCELPDWIKTRLATYKYKASNGNYLMPINSHEGEHPASANEPSKTMRASKAEGQYYLIQTNQRNSNGKKHFALNEPSPTVTSAMGQLTFDGYIARRLNSRCLARFQTFPDSYELPETKTLAATIVGNAVPCNGAEAIARCLINLS